MLPITRHGNNSEGGVIHCLEMVREGFLEKGNAEVCLFVLINLYVAKNEHEFESKSLEFNSISRAH